MYASDAGYESLCKIRCTKIERAGLKDRTQATVLSTIDNHSKGNKVNFIITMTGPLTAAYCRMTGPLAHPSWCFDLTLEDKSVAITRVHKRCGQIFLGRTLDLVSGVKYFVHDCAFAYLYREPRPLIIRLSYPLVRSLNVLAIIARFSVLRHQ